MASNLDRAVGIPGKARRRRTREPVPIIVLMLFVAIPAFAGRPLTTDDASVLEDKACQVESWVDRSKAATTFWIVPACNFGGGIEWQFGAARTREQLRSRQSEISVQAKAVLPAAEKSPWNLGIVFGLTRRPLEAQFNGWDNPYVVVPFSVLPPNSRNAFHANIGWRLDRAGLRNVTLWGLAAETGIGERFTLLGEVFGENSEKPSIRVGGRYSAIKDHLDLDLSLVTRPGGNREERWVSLGVTWQSGRFLP